MTALTGRTRAMIIALIAVVVAILSAPSAAAGTVVPAHRVVVIGIPGLLWSDVSESQTPALWKLTGAGSAAVMSVRTTITKTCPVDGWLTLSAGQRARLVNSGCALPPTPSPDGTGAAVPGWNAIAKDNAGTGYAAKVGSLGGAVRASGGCTLAVGAGGVFGAADLNGRVDVYEPTVDEVGDWSRCPLAVVDVDDVFKAFIKAGVDSDGTQVPVDILDRQVAASLADQKVAKVLAKIPAGTTVLVAGLSDATPVPHLHPAVGFGPGFGPGYLIADSTRSDGLVTLTDLTSAVLHGLGITQPKEAVGSPWRTVASDDDASAKVTDLNDEDVAAGAIRRMGGVFFVVLFAGQLLLYGFAAITLRRRWGTAHRGRILAATRVVALLGGAAPVATFLANVIPWWQASRAAPALLACVLVAAALVTAVSLAGPWRRTVTGPGLVIAAITALVLGYDAMSGSSLQMNAFMGYTALVGGRFYGFGNMAFALFAIASILTAAWLTELLPAARIRLQVAAVFVIGLVAMVVDGMPGWGSDFGGVIAIVLGTVVLALLTAGQRISVAKLGVTALVGTVIVLAMAFADSLRPSETHLGKFWDQLVAGEAWGVIGRKFGAMLHSFGYWPFTVVAIGALLFLYLVLARPLSWRAAALDRAYQQSRSMRPALMAGLTVAIVGMLMNDSGVEIPALVFTLAIPLVLAACVRALELDGAGTSTPEPQEEPSTQTA